MAQSFKIKLEKLSDAEFAEILVNRDQFSGKKLSLVEQEARNRYFSNKEFNGENDIYLNPAFGQVEVVKSRNIVKYASVSGGLLVLVFVFIIAKNFFTEKSGQIATVDHEMTVKQAKTIPNDETVNISVESPDNNTSNQNQTKANVLTPAETNKSQPVDLEQKSNFDQTSNTSKVANPTPETKQTIITNKADSEKILQQAPVTDDKVNQTNNLPKSEPAKTTLPDNKNSQINQPDLNKNNQSQDKTELPKEKEPVATEPIHNQNSKPKESKITELSTELMRKLVKFQNEWAFKQTSVQGVVDYYVDGNVVIKFILDQTYSDSLNQYQRRLIPNLTGKYWKDHEKELGTQFPRTPMQISFVRFDAEY